MLQGSLWGDPRGTAFKFLQARLRVRGREEAVCAGLGALRRSLRMARIEALAVAGAYPAASSALTRACDAGGMRCHAANAYEEHRLSAGHDGSEFGR